MEESCTFRVFFRASIVDWYQYEPSAASALQECFRACLKCTAKMILVNRQNHSIDAAVSIGDVDHRVVMQLSSVCSQQGRHQAAHGAFGALL